MVWSILMTGLMCFMRILLVEDEKKVADIVARGLKAERYAVDVVHDGINGSEMANAYDYDLAILDLMLPGMNGTELLGKIRRKNPQIPILILTARDCMDDKVKNFEAGADDYLTKPFSPRELMLRIGAVLRRSKKITTLVEQRIGDFRLDRKNMALSINDKLVDLTITELKLITALIAEEDARMAATEGPI